VYSGLLWGCLREKVALGRPRPRWEDDIKMDLLEMELGAGAWVGLNWLRIGSDGGLL
jgi:hypothetical protein